MNTLFYGYVVFFHCQNIAAVKGKSGDTKYDLTIYTGSDEWAGTEANISVQLYGDKGESKLIHLPCEPENYEKNKISTIQLQLGEDLGDIKRLRIGHDNTGRSPGWFLKKIDILHRSSYQTNTFYVGRWLVKDLKTSTEVMVDKKEKVECGKTIVPKIENVEEAMPNQWPWLAYIQSGLTECGGTLLHPLWIITSAQCIVDVKPSAYKVRLGEHDLTLEDYTEQLFTASKIIVHPDYYPFSVENEIALIRLDKPASLDEYVNVVCLPSPDEEMKEVKDCYLAGWGSGQTKFRKTVYVKHSQIKLLGDKDCNKLMEKEVDGFNVTKSMFCTNHQGDPEYIGDIGSPLMCNKKNIFYLDGALCWMHPGYGNTSLSVFTKISKFIKWIHTNIYSEYVFK